MSRRLAADKRPNGQTLQSLESFAHVRDSREPGGPKGRDRGLRRPEDEDGSPARGSTFPNRSLQHNTRFSPHPEKTDFRSSLQKNVFIDSYYPVVQANCSEASRNSHSSYEDIYKDGVSTDGRKTDGFWETDSEEGYQDLPSVKIDSVDPLPSSAPNRSQRSSSIINTVCPAFDSRTYTVLSCSSDLDSTFVNISQPPKEGTSGNTVPDDDHLASSAVGCFTQLYHRIHNLEDLLQQTVGTSHANDSSVERLKNPSPDRDSESGFDCGHSPRRCSNQSFLHGITTLSGKSAQPKESKHAKTVGGEEEKPSSAKKKSSEVKTKTAGVARTWESKCLSIPEATDEKTNSDTDNELRNIKKRLRILERKLRGTKPPPLPPSFSLHRNPHEPLTSSSVMLTEIGGRCCGRSRDVESSVPHRSETESFVQSEVFLLNGGPCERSEGDSCDKKPRTKVRKKFISRCRRIRKKCSGMMSSAKKISSKNSPLKVSTTSEWSEVLFKRSILTEESVATTLLNQSFSTHTKTDSSTVVYLRCQHEGPLEPPRKPRKKNGKKRKYLCKKNSKMNILSFRHCTNSPAKEFTNAFVCGDCNLPSSNPLHICDGDKKPHPAVFDKSVWKGNPVGDSPTWEPHPLWIPFQHKCCLSPTHRCPPWYQEGRDCTLKATKSPKKSPLDLLKRGGKLKIPVLFEEVCKTPDPKDPSHKFSNVSMRFVVVEEDSGHPLTPLRKLINKLSQAKPPHKGEQFVFGVSKCHCDSQVQGLSSISQRNVTRGFS